MQAWRRVALAILGAAVVLAGGPARAQWRASPPVPYLDLVEDYRGGDADAAIVTVCGWSKERILKAASDLFTFVLAATDDDTRAVRLPEGRPVGGLVLGDFEVFDNGVRQQVRTLLGEAVPLDVYLVLDVSTSVEGERLGHLRRAAHAFLAGLVAGDRAALLAFSHQVLPPQPLSADLAAARAAIDAIEPAGATALDDALYAGLLLHEAGDRRGVVVVFSDGVENMSWLQDDEVAEAARRADVLVHGITLTPDRPAGWVTLSSGQTAPALPPENDLLRRAAAATGGRLWHAATSADLEAVFVGVLREIRSRYILAYDPQPAGQRGWHDVRVTVKDKGRQVSARPGYFAR